ncbi:MAG TPA: metalloregulator ArsR/SmtB family transcription factor [Longimicrobiales bacterium]|nr:metalloregulator ArsR/SmtB family transcription factor [Longimicrobiales bacterium]
MATRRPKLDRVFHALAHPARLAVLERLTQGPASVSELAEPFGMALPSFMQHLAVLETGGLIDSTKEGRVRTYRLTPRALAEAEGWLGKQRALWAHRLDQLDDYLLQLRDRANNDESDE